LFQSNKGAATFAPGSRRRHEDPRFRRNQYGLLIGTELHHRKAIPLVTIGATVYHDAPYMEACQMRSSMNGLMMVGAVLALLGPAGLAIPVFTTSKTEDVAKIGDLKLQATQNTSYVVPPMLSGGALVLGIVLIGAGFFQKR
jgi:hypothetical protein